MSFLDEMDSKSGLLSAQGARSIGRELAQDYASAMPFPHVVIDDFMPPSLLEMCLHHFPEVSDQGAVTYNESHERLKTQYQPDFLDPELRTLFSNFNSLPFLRVIENITGIKGLIPDPYFLGAGLHNIKNGGHLSIHADFNHHKPLNLERRINVLIYLNHQWEPEFGGQLELWDEDAEHCQKSIVPAFNRCVIFNTTSSSFHGNPVPVSHPEGISRKSIALYYYTSTWTASMRNHSTRFRSGQGDIEAASKSLWARELFEDLTPPAMQRALSKIKSLKR